MIQNVLRAIGGVGNFGVLSICIFFFIFGAALLWAFSLRSSFLKSMSALPLEDGTTPKDNQNDRKL